MDPRGQRGAGLVVRRRYMRSRVSWIPETVWRKRGEKRPQNVGRQRCGTSQPAVIHSGTKTRGQNHTEASLHTGRSVRSHEERTAKEGLKSRPCFGLNAVMVGTGWGGDRVRGRPTPRRWRRGTEARGLPRAPGPQAIIDSGWQVWWENCEGHRCASSFGEIRQKGPPTHRLFGSESSTLCFSFVCCRGDRGPEWEC